VALLVVRLIRFCFEAGSGADRFSRPRLGHFAAVVFPRAVPDSYPTFRPGGRPRRHLLRYSIRMGSVKYSFALARSVLG
jgi:hypothetical protein